MNSSIGRASTEGAQRDLKKNGPPMFGSLSQWMFWTSCVFPVGPWMTLDFSPAHWTTQVAQHKAVRRLQSCPSRALTLQRPTPIQSNDCKACISVFPAAQKLRIPNAVPQDHGTVHLQHALGLHPRDAFVAAAGVPVSEVPSCRWTSDKFPTWSIPMSHHSS